MPTPVRKVALCMMAHPDDCEFLAAGTLILLAQKGWEIHIISATPGDCGSKDLGPEQIGAKRRAEGAAAAKLIGATYHCLELRDLHVTYDENSIRRTMTLVRSIAPTLIFTHSLQDYMPDHEVTAQLARNASIGWFVPNSCAGPIPPGAGMPHLYYADPAGLTDYYGHPVKPSIIVDIASVFEQKMAMLCAHASQRQWLFDHYGIDEYTNSLKVWGGQRGKEIGTAWAEGFRQHKGLGYPQDCVLKTELGELVHSV
jgi:LmbE family N-acetylglucosaminyl deacetylase